MAEQITVRLPEELLTRARRKAAAEGRRLAALIEEGLRAVVLSDTPKPRPGGPLPVSSATGGLRPGDDISSNAAIQEMEDLEYIERLKRGFE